MTGSISTSKKKKSGSAATAIWILIGAIIVSVVTSLIVVNIAGAGGNGDVTSGKATFLDGIKSRGELRVGASIAPPLIAEQPDGELGGPNLIPLQRVADALGVKLTVIPVDSGQRVPGLQAGRYDFAANLDSTLERSLAVQFTDDVYEYQGVWLVREDSPYRTSEDILAAGIPIAVAQGTAYVKPLTDLGYDLLETGDDADALANVNSGRAAAEFTDLPSAVGQAQADSGIKIIVPATRIYAAGAAYGVPAGIDQHSLNTINIAIGEARESGELERSFAEVGYVELDKLGDLQKQ
jgi:ABC-type amino acid transport substrate-binding protein